MKRTDLTLLEQMKISDVEINSRKELIGLTHEKLQLLSRLKSIIDDQLDQIVDIFYEIQTSSDEISLLIGDADTLRRLRAAQRNYVLDLFSGHIDSVYVNNRLRIGMVHKRIGVEPKLYLSAVRTLKSILYRTFANFIDDQAELLKANEALDCLLYFDTTLVFDTYIDSLVGEIETAKRRTEIYAKSLEAKVADRTKQLEELAKQDPLTSIYNQRAMQELLRRELAHAKRRQKELSFVYFDVDKFKEINDTFGHVKGDEVLKSIGHILEKTTREVDVACRYGGDEFCIILPDCGLKNAEKICEKIGKAFLKKYPDFSLSMGIAKTGPEKFISQEELIKLADEQMYLSKKHTGIHISYKSE